MVSSIKFAPPVPPQSFLLFPLRFTEMGRYARNTLLLRVLEWITLISGNAREGEKHN